MSCRPGIDQDQFCIYEWLLNEEPLPGLPTSPVQCAAETLLCVPFDTNSVKAFHFITLNLHMADAIKPSQASYSIHRVARIFISSTFRDMQPEREELAVRCFPALRYDLRDEVMDIADIDLRWGITLGQSRRRETAAICLSEIDRCFPFFLGLLGDRYGWVPSAEDLPERLLAEHPWLADQSGLSITEIEFQHGVLRNPASFATSRFYSKYTLEEARVKAERGVCDLLAKLLAAGAVVRCGFRDAKTLGQWVREDYKALLRGFFPPMVDAAEREETRHRYLADCEAGAFFGRSDDTRALSRLAGPSGRSGTPPIAILGEEGMGKAALAANWIRRERPHSADESMFARLTRVFRREPRKRDVVIERTAGTEGELPDLGSLSLSIIRALRREANIPRPAPDSPVHALREFPTWLKLAANCVQLTLVVLHVDRAERDPQRLASWLGLPGAVPARVIVTVTDDGQGSYEKPLRASGFRIQRVTAPKINDNIGLVSSILKSYGKTLEIDAGVRQRMDRRTPKFIVTFADEMRAFGQFGDHGEKLRERMLWYLDTDGMRELYCKMLSRWETDLFEECESKCFRGILAHLLPIKHGVPESVFLGLIQRLDLACNPFHWTRFRVVAENRLFKSDSGISIQDTAFRAAVADFIRTEMESLAAARRRIVEALSRVRFGISDPSELLWQWEALQDWGSIRDFVSDPDQLARYWTTHEFVFKRLIAGVALRFGISVRSLFVADRIFSAGIGGAVHTLRLLLDHGENKLVSGYMADLWERWGDRPSLNERRQLLAVQADASAGEAPLDALRFYQEEERYCIQLEDDAARAACLGNQATAFGRLNMLPQAAAAHAEEERICRSRGYWRLLAGSLINQSRHMPPNENVKQVLRRLQEAESIARLLRDPILISRACILQGTIWDGQLSHKHAAAAYRHAVEALRGVGEVEPLAFALVGLANSLRRTGDYDAALAAIDEASAIVGVVPAMAEKIVAARWKILGGVQDG